jgi:hypothetical protein
MRESYQRFRRVTTAVLGDSSLQDAVPDDIVLDECDISRSTADSDGLCHRTGRVGDGLRVPAGGSWRRDGRGSIDRQNPGSRSARTNAALYAEDNNVPVGKDVGYGTDSPRSAAACCHSPSMPQRVLPARILSYKSPGSDQTFMDGCRLD